MQDMDNYNRVCHAAGHPIAAAPNGGKLKTGASIITIMINMALTGGTLGKEAPLYGEKMDNGEEYMVSFQTKLLLVCVICVPWMLIPKPIIEVCMLPSHDDGDHASGDKV